MCSDPLDRTPQPGLDYDGLGEFHDLFMDPAIQRLQPVLRDAFGRLGPDDVVVDLGAGTGLGTRALAGQTRARIIAVEPSQTTRAVLTARVADDPTLTERVTVLAAAAPQVVDDLPDLAGFVCSHVLGHLTSQQRAATFAGLAARLRAGGVGVVTVNPDVLPAAEPTEPTTLERWIGSQRYTVRYLPAADGEHASEYQVSDRRGRVLRTERFGGTWHRLTADLLRQELAPQRWQFTEAAPQVLLVRHCGVR
ncbi:MAG: class I SAM-dependent methyltransferase [Propionicimonas sp.]